MLMPSSVSSSPAVKIKGGGVAATTPSSTINPPPIGGGRHYFSTLLRQMDQEKVLSKIEEGTANGKTTNNIVGDDGEKVKTQNSPKGITHKIRVILPHVLLFLSTILYGLFGALVFQRLERPFEVLHLQEHTEAIIKAQNELFVFPNSSQKISNISKNIEIEEEILIEKAIDNLIKLYMEAFEQGIRADELAIAIEDFNSKNNLKNQQEKEEEENNLLLHRRLPKWHFHSSLFFTATLLTSIGYGNLVPISPFGRLFCICYAFLGIPLTLITIADVAKYLSDLILNIGNWLEKKFEGKKKKNERKEEENEIKNKNNSSPIIKINEENEGEKERKNVEEEEDEDEETGGILRQPGPYTKGFVLFLLFGYMMTMAFLFWHVQPDWGLLESIYFTLITLTVDMVGYSYIERIHTLGRGFHLGSLLTMLKLGRGDAGPDSARLLRQLHAGAFIPADLKLIPYIDQLLSQRPSIETVLFDNGSGQKSGFSFLPDPTKGKDDFGNRNARNRKRNTGIFV